MDHKLPTDADLTRKGMPPHGRGRTLVIACGALAREIADFTTAHDLRHISLTCLPAILHNRPEKIPNAVRAAVEQHRASYERILIGYGDCGTGGQLAQICQELGVEMLPGPHCYSFFDGNAAFAQRSESEFRTFYLTDFLVRQFSAFVIEPLGLDRHPELRDQYFGNYEKLSYLAQTDDPALGDLAASHAERLGLIYERRLTGYGDLGTVLKSL